MIKFVKLETDLTLVKQEATCVYPEATLVNSSRLLRMIEPETALTLANQDKS